MKIAANRRASSLIITLLVLVVLSTIVVAFMQSMSIERMTARSVANSYQAQLAAEAGLAAALEKMSTSAAPNQVVAYDRSVADESLRPLAFFPLSANGVMTNTNSLALSGAPAAGTNHTFRLGTNVTKRSEMYLLLNAEGKTNGAYAVYVQDNASKQNLIRYQSVNRTFAATLRELPLITESNVVLSATAKGLLNAASIANTNWFTNLLTPATFNQLAGTENPNVSEKWADTLNYSALSNREGKVKINLRRLKFYLDTLSSSQAIGNPKANVVNALVGQPSTVDPVSSWGGGTLEWLTSSRNPNPYTLDQAKQIAANLIDYLDEDLHATTDNPAAPAYLGVEGRFESNGTGTFVRGHPYVVALGFGLVFNLSNAGGNVGALNSTRVLVYWALVNPWSGETLNITGGSSYQPEFEIEIAGTATGGARGSEAKNYFLPNLNERLTDGPVQKLAANAGSTFPQTPSGLSFANFYDLNNLVGRQPPGMSFQNVKFVIKKARLRFLSTDNTQSYVQILDGLNGMEIPMTPSSFTLPTQGGSITYNPGQTRVGIFLNSDPRLNFLTSSWIGGQLTSSTGSSGVPTSNPVTAVFSAMHMAEGDGAQGLPNNSTWYTARGTTNHFFVRSPQRLVSNPVSSPYAPVTAPAAVAVDSIGELGYLHTGKPWQTLNLLRKDATASKPDYMLLDYVDAGTMPVTNLPNLATNRVNGKINVNTATAQTLRGLFTDIPGLSEPVITDLISVFSNSAQTTNYPFVGSVDYGAITNFGRGVTNKFQREDLARRIANMTTSKSDNFTIYSYGEARQGVKTVGRANLTAVVELFEGPGGKMIPRVIRKTWK